MKCIFLVFFLSTANAVVIYEQTNTSDRTMHTRSFSTSPLALDIKTLSPDCSSDFLKTLFKKDEQNKIKGTSLKTLCENLLIRPPSWNSTEFFAKFYPTTQSWLRQRQAAETCKLDSALNKNSDDFDLQEAERISSLERIQRGSSELIQQAIWLSQMIGYTDLSLIIKCKQLYVNEKECTNQTSQTPCSNSKNLSLLAVEVSASLKRIDSLEKQISSLAIKRDNNRSYNIQKNKLKQLIAFEKSLYPWIEGSEFKTAIKKNPISIKQALLRQFKKNLIDVNSQLSEFTTIGNCLLGKQQGNSCLNYQKTMIKTPPLEFPTDRSNKQALYARTLLTSTDCLQFQRQTADHLDKLYQETFTSLGLTLLSGGFLGLPRIALMIKELQQGSKALTVSNFGKALSSSEIMNINSMQIEHIARLGLVSIDSISLFINLKEAFTECDSLLNQLKKSPILDNTNTCEKQNQHYQLLSDYKACAIRVASASLFGGLPLLATKRLPLAKQTIIKGELAQKKPSVDVNVKEINLLTNPKSSILEKYIISQNSMDHMDQHVLEDSIFQELEAVTAKLNQRYKNFVVAKTKTGHALNITDEMSLEIKTYFEKIKDLKLSRTKTSTTIAPKSFRNQVLGELQAKAKNLKLQDQERELTIFTYTEKNSDGVLTEKIVMKKIEVDGKLVDSDEPLTLAFTNNKIPLDRPDYIPKQSVPHTSKTQTVDGVFSENQFVLVKCIKNHGYCIDDRVADRLFHQDEIVTFFFKCGANTMLIPNSLEIEKCITDPKREKCLNLIRTNSAENRKCSQRK